MPYDADAARRQSLSAARTQDRRVPPVRLLLWEWVAQLELHLRQRLPSPPPGYYRCLTCRRIFPIDHDHDWTTTLASEVLRRTKMQTRW